MDEIDPLPEYMKIVYRFLMSIYKDYERDATKQEKSFAISYFREAVRTNSYLYLTLDIDISVPYPCM